MHDNLCHRVKCFSFRLQGNMYSRFSRNSEAVASEFLENIENVFHQKDYTHI